MSHIGYEVPCPQCGEAIDVSFAWVPFVPASRWSPAEGGYAEDVTFPDVCPTSDCGREFTARDARYFERAVVAAASDAAVNE